MGQWVMVQKVYSKMHPAAFTNTHYDVTDLVNHGMAKNRKLSRERNMIFLSKKFLTCVSDCTFGEVTVLQRR